METPETPENSGAQADRAAPLLDLETLIIRPAIRIDGMRFEIMSPDELSILDGTRFGRWGRRINELASHDIDSPEDQTELEDLIDRLARRVAVGVPDDIFVKLSGAHKQAIADVFTGLLLRNRLGVAGAIAKAAGMALPTGESSSPSSAGSMAGRRSGGWLKRLRPWSAHT